MARFTRLRLHGFGLFVLGLLVAQPLFVCQSAASRRTAVAATLSILANAPSIVRADEIDDEVADYIKKMKKFIVVEDNDKPWRQKEQFNYNYEFQEGQKEFVRQKYLKMKEMVKNARNEKEREKAMRVMKNEWLRESVSITDTDLLKGFS
ncbi:unnamed protein product [Durusdinium trenchii]|uniref:Uncharacterized protein n=2 Tax=Durusdinium trenchii TaxID=1381693 RepID=A0ABP0RNE9_9DINO